MSDVSIGKDWTLGLMTRGTVLPMNIKADVVVQEVGTSASVHAWLP